MKKKEDIKMIRSQLDKRLSVLRNHFKIMPPLVGGWIRLVRKSLGMTQVQLAKRLNITPQTLSEIEKYEQKNTITLATLKRIGHALECSVYVTFIPKIPLENIVAEQAKKIAQKMVRQTAHTMALEKQQPSKEYLKQQIEELAAELVRSADKRIWED